MGVTSFCFVLSFIFKWLLDFFYHFYYSKMIWKKPATSQSYFSSFLVHILRCVTFLRTQGMTEELQITASSWASSEFFYFFCIPSFPSCNVLHVNFYFYTESSCKLFLFSSVSNKISCLNLHLCFITFNISSLSFSTGERQWLWGTCLVPCQVPSTDEDSGTDRGDKGQFSPRSTFSGQAVL